LSTIDETKEMKNKALRQLIKGLDTDDKKQKVLFINLLGNTVALGVKVDAEQEAIEALENETQNKNGKIKRAAKKALEKINETKRNSPNPLDMFSGGVGFTSKK